MLHSLGTKINILALAGLLFLTSSLPVTAQGISDPLKDERGYILHVPSKLPSKKVPLLVVLHGGGGSAQHIKNHLRMDNIADQYGFIVVYLNGTQSKLKNVDKLRSWNAGGGCCGPAFRENVDDVEYIQEFIRKMVRYYPVDRLRVFMTGHSNGSMMTYRFACEESNMLAGFIAISGPLGINYCRASGLQGLHIHGASDDRVPVEGGKGTSPFTEDVVFRSVSDTVKKLERAGARMEVKILPNTGHDIDEISLQLKKTEGSSLAETIARFITDKKR